LHEIDVIMKKKFKKLNDYKIKELLNSPDLNQFSNELPYFLDRLGQGKLFFNHDKTKEIQEMAPMFFGKSLVIYSNEMVQNYVTQYNEFKSLVSEEYPDLFQIEENYIVQNIFTKKHMAHPMEYVNKSVLFYGDSTGSALMSRIGEVGKDLLEINSRAELSSSCDQEALKLLRESLEFPKKQDTKILDHLQSFIKKAEKYPSKERFSENIDQIRILNSLKSSSLESFKKNPVEIVRNFLTGIQDAQSHIEYFCKHIHRLVHIKKYGNQKYEDEYYRYNSKMFDEEKFRDMCKSKLNDYPDLKNFLRRYCITFKDLRKIRAHQVTGDTKILSGGFIWIPNIENEKGKYIDYREKREKMITYGVFINKISLYSQSPYDESEDVFIILER